MKTIVDQSHLIFSPPELGGVLYLPGLPGSGGKIQDRSPYGNIGTITGAVWQVLPGGIPCLYFDGVDDVVSVASAPSLKPLTDSWTVKLWFKTSLNQRQILLTCDDGSDGFYLDVYDSKELHFLVRDGGSYDAITGNTPNLHDGKWHQAVGVRDEEDGKLYIFLDGRLDKTPVVAANTTGKSVAPTSNLLLSPASSFQFQGCLAFIEVQRRAWQALDVKNSFNREKCIFGVW